MSAAILVGLGQVGMGYDLALNGVIQNQTMTHIKALEQSEYFTLLAGIDNDQDKIEMASKNFNSFFCNSLKELTDSSKIGLIAIATPTISHKSIIRGIPKTLIPDVLLIEKPAGDNLHACLWIKDWGIKNSALIYVNYFRRFLPEIQKAKAFIHEIELGRLISVHITAYGTLLNIFSHFMDLGIFLSGRDLFCDCKEKFRFQIDLDLVHHCYSCDVRYSFRGLGQSKRDCSAIITFSDYVIEVSLDGRTIKILDSSGLLVAAYSSSSTDFLNYQRFVYLEIGKNASSDNPLSGLNQAIQIHAFVESLE